MGLPAADALGTRTKANSHGDTKDKKIHRSTTRRLALPRAIESLRGVEHPTINHCISGSDFQHNQHGNPPVRSRVPGGLFFICIRL